MIRVKLVINSGKKINHELSLINTKSRKDFIFFYETNFNKLNHTNQNIITK
jgi:hypothetical protein